MTQAYLLLVALVALAVLEVQTKDGREKDSVLSTVLVMTLTSTY